MTAYPDYYPAFRCTAADCRHSCCKGWEIDIDEATLGRYLSEDGELGSRLKNAISDDGDPHFILGKDERCPFLNRDNLCDLILEKGDDYLCQICTDHPRFRNFLPGYTEIGLGLCCEAAGRLILSRKDCVSLVLTGEETDLDAADAALLEFRNYLLSIAQNRQLTLEARMDALMAECGISIPELSYPRLAAYLAHLERFDSEWDGALRLLGQELPETDKEAFRLQMQERDEEYEQLLVYFLYRHVLSSAEDRDVPGRVAFAVLSTKILEQLGALHFWSYGSYTLDDQISYARMYSAEIEYSDENLSRMLELLT